MNNMKNSIKREQSQACLNFAERKNFRLQAKKKILMTLALLITAVGGAWAQSTLSVVEFEVPADWENNKNLVTAADLPGLKAVTLDEAKAWTGAPKKGTAFLVYAFDGDKVCNVPFSNGTALAGTNVSYQKQDVFSMKSDAKFFITTEPSGLEVTLNEAKTEATFEMPEYDMDLSYELVRDMSVQMQAQVGDDPAKEPRYRVQWNDEKETFVPAELNQEQVMALFSVNDLIEKTTLAQTSYFVNIYAVDAEGNPTGDAMTFQTFTFAPGRYAVTATGLPGGPYDGTTALSNIFELFQGYEIKVAAGEYATYYKDEALRVEDQEVELLTITAVENGKAVLSDASDAMPTNTPFLVHNNGTEEKTILLIPCNEPDLAITVAEEFKGTLTAKEFTEDDMAGADFYVCNGKEFIKVRGAGTLAANKAYLKVTGNAPASIPFRRSIDGNGEGTTGIDNVNANDNLNDNEATWYDLGGRKLNGKPAQKGIYIKNGRKVVVK